jgi:hypothetical protein
MTCSLTTIRDSDWIGNRLLRTDGCYDTSEGAKCEPTTGGSADSEHESRAGAQSTDRSPRKRSRPYARLGRRLTLANAAKEYVWLWDLRHGISVRAIASREGLPIRRVRFGLARAQAQEQGCGSESTVRPPRLVPLFPIGPYSPLSRCRHTRPIQSGSLLCCMICHESGMDRHPALRRDPRTDPKPEPEPTSKLQTVPRETRKERRLRRFGT